MDYDETESLPLELTPRQYRKSGPLPPDGEDEIDATIRAKEHTERRLISENIVLRANLAVLLARVTEADATVADMDKRVSAMLTSLTGQRKDVDAVLGRMRQMIAKTVALRKAKANAPEVKA